MSREVVLMTGISNSQRALKIAACAFLATLSAFGQSAPDPSSPPDGAFNQPLSMTLQWSPVFLATSYEVHLSTNSNFQPLFRDLGGINTTSVEITDLEYGTTYFWRVRAFFTLAAGAWSDASSLTTMGSPTTHTIVLNEGWNMVSSYVLPGVSALDTLFSGIIDNLVIIKNGKGEVFFPTVANTLLHWDYRDGYQVYMRGPDTLVVDGNAIVPHMTPLSLSMGWNLISYLKTDSMTAESALAGIVSNLVIMKSNDGRVYWPQYGVNQIGYLKPGDGYQIYLSAASTLTYTAGAQP